MKITSVSKRNRSMSTKGNVKTDRVSYATYYSYTIDNSRVLFEEPIPLFSWDLQNYSSTIKLSVEEVDEKETSKNEHPPFVLNDKRRMFLFSNPML